MLALTEPDTQNVLYYPSKETVLKESMSLVVLAERSQVEQLRAIVQAG